MLLNAIRGEKTSEYHLRLIVLISNRIEFSRGNEYAIEIKNIFQKLNVGCGGVSVKKTTAEVGLMKPERGVSDAMTVGKRASDAMSGILLVCIMSERLDEKNVILCDPSLDATSLAAKAIV